MSDDALIPPPSIQSWYRDTKRYAAYMALLELPPEERVSVMGFYCRSCGRNDPRCPCTHDE